VPAELLPCSTCSCKHPPDLWKPPLWYKLLHPRSWRRTQAAALALMPTEDRAEGPPTMMAVGNAYITAVSVSSGGSGYTSPPTIVSH
jgi:hypothetical protein